MILGQAHAQQGDYERASRYCSAPSSLIRRSKAHGALGLIYLKQGRLPEAAEALRRELEIQPDEVSARHHLATVLNPRAGPTRPCRCSGRCSSPSRISPTRGICWEKSCWPKGAAPRRWCISRPQHAPEDANIHYQLAQAYQTLGRLELAEQDLEIFRRLKEKQRGRTP